MKNLIFFILIFSLGCSPIAEKPKPVFLNFPPEYIYYPYDGELKKDGSRSVIVSEFKKKYGFPPDHCEFHYFKAKPRLDGIVTFCESEINGRIYRIDMKFYR